MLESEYSADIDEMYRLMNKRKPLLLPGVEISPYIDSIHARYYEGYDISPFTEEFINQLMDGIQRTKFTYALTGNKAQTRIQATGMFESLVVEFGKHVDEDKGLKVKNKRKLFYYSDHDDSYTILSVSLEIPMKEYPPFAS